MPRPFHSLGLGFDVMKNFNQHFAFPKLCTDFVPRVDMYQTEQDIMVKAELPGMNTDDTLDIKVTNESITIRGEIKRNQKHDSEHCCHQECFNGTFMRVLTLPTEVYAEKAVAEYVNGLLTITIPKKPSSVTQGFSVQVNLPRGPKK